jgi:hypothetical protein
MGRQGDAYIPQVPFTPLLEAKGVEQKGGLSEISIRT